MLKEVRTGDVSKQRRNGKKKWCHPDTTDAMVERFASLVERCNNVLKQTSRAFGELLMPPQPSMDPDTTDRVPVSGEVSEEEAVGNN